MKLRYYVEKTKYVVADYWEYTLKLRYKTPKAFDNGKFFLKLEDSKWIIGCYPGFRTDGVTSWVDNKFLLKASFGHDILCKLIEEGALSPLDNNTIDAEFELMILENNKNYPIYKGGNLIKLLRARLARRGTNLAHSKPKDDPEIFELL